MREYPACSGTHPASSESSKQAHKTRMTFCATIEKKETKLAGMRMPLHDNKTIPRLIGFLLWQKFTTLWNLLWDNMQKHASQCVFQQKLATFEKSENWGKRKHCPRANPASIQQNSQGESKRVMIDALSA
jgi:hypothetical protein